MRLIASAGPSMSFLRPTNAINQNVSLARRRVIHVQRVAALRDLISAA
jgi:putative transposase